MTAANRSREAIEGILRARLERAQNVYSSAREKSRQPGSVVGDVGPAHPDGVFALRQAEREQRTASRAYRKALADFNAFVVDGVLPDDLNPGAT